MKLDEFWSKVHISESQHIETLTRARKNPKSVKEHSVISFVRSSYADADTLAELVHIYGPDTNYILVHRYEEALAEIAFSRKTSDDTFAFMRENIERKCLSVMWRCAMHPRLTYSDRKTYLESVYSEARMGLVENPKTERWMLERIKDEEIDQDGGMSPLGALARRVLEKRFGDS